MQDQGADAVGMNRPALQGSATESRSPNQAVVLLQSALPMCFAPARGGPGEKSRRRPCSEAGEWPIHVKLSESASVATGLLVCWCLRGT